MTAVKSMTPYLMSVPPRSSGTELHVAINDLASQRHAVAHLMAASMASATPRELCGLRALLDHAALHADVVHFDCPTDDQLHRYMERMALYENLPENVVLSRPRPHLRSSDHGKQLVELRRIDCADDVEAVAERVWKVAEGHFGSHPIARACATAIAAAAENVLDHANSPIGALVAAQRYKTTGLELAVVDLGLGIPAKLTSAPEYAHISDLAAVERALDDGVTSTGEPGRGAGLMELRSTVQRAGSSTLIIQSGRAHVIVGSADEPTRLLTPSVPVPGTWIAIRLRPQRPTTQP
jgi:hypothetical protein